MYTNEIIAWLKCLLHHRVHQVHKTVRIQNSSWVWHKVKVQNETIYDTYTTLFVVLLENLDEIRDCQHSYINIHTHND